MEPSLMRAGGFVTAGLGTLYALVGLLSKSAKAAGLLKAGVVLLVFTLVCFLIAWFKRKQLERADAATAKPTLRIVKAERRD